MTEVIYRQMGLPAFQNKVYPDAQSARAAKTGDVELVQSPETGLVYNRLFKSDELDYDENYQNEQGYSPAFQQHLQSVLATLTDNFKGMTGIEVGCGKGLFLEMMQKAGADITGYDPAYQGTNPAIHKRYYDPAEGHKPDYLIFRHVMEHIDRPFDFLAKMAAGCKPGCLIYIEVPCFDWIVQNRAFYDVFYEHCNYFTLAVLKAAFGKVVSAGHVFGGQYLSVIADLSTFRIPDGAAVPRYGYMDFSDGLEKLLARRNPGGKTFIWGAGAKGMVFSNMLKKRGIAVESLIDINPVKQGRYTGLSAIKIQPPAVLANENEPNIMIMNPVYEAEIRKLVASPNAKLISVV